MKNRIENKKVWIEVITETNETYVVSADQQNCGSCSEFVWVIGFTINGKAGDCKCVPCLTEKEKICDKRYCAFCTKTADIKPRVKAATGLKQETEPDTDPKICTICATSLIDNTVELYQVCKVPKVCVPACKYCKIFRPSKKLDPLNIKAVSFVST
jgi:hypothetical protein